MVELVVRLVFSLAVVIGMLLLIARFSAKRFKGGANAPIKVLHRQPLSRSSSVAVVTVGSRVLVLGTTEQQVQLLTELDPEELEVMDPTLESELDQLAAPVVAAPAAAPAPVAARTFEPATFAPAAALAASVEDAPVQRKAKVRRKQAAAPRPVPVTDGPLAGSLLSAQTWKQALAAATGRGMDLS
ncbi:FliO/MopB family protein [Nocardioides caldifontis]|uniref:FliO/MopB family protein n=1 Tax=Nocardioides caldifontis TaxID=2588938 RepID=UPI0011DF443F|nr:flagellar biosynthetic protein FliO [Nocardioides caldifontis]